MSVSVPLLLSLLLSLSLSLPAVRYEDFARGATLCRRLFAFITTTDTSTNTIRNSNSDSDSGTGKTGDDASLDDAAALQRAVRVVCDKHFPQRRRRLLWNINVTSMGNSDSGTTRELRLRQSKDSSSNDSTRGSSRGDPDYAAMYGELNFDVTRMRRSGQQRLEGFHHAVQKAATTEQRTELNRIHRHLLQFGYTLLPPGTGTGGDGDGDGGSRAGRGVFNRWDLMQ